MLYSAFLDPDAIIAAIHSQLVVNDTRFYLTMTTCRQRVNRIGDQIDKDDIQRFLIDGTDKLLFAINGHRNFFVRERFVLEIDYSLNELIHIYGSTLSSVVLEKLRRFSIMLLAR